MKVTSYAALICGIIFSMALMGCETSSDSSSTTTFSNESQPTVHVQPKGDETFAPFSLATGESTTIVFVGKDIDFEFSANGNVNSLTIGNSQVVFTDPN